MASTSIDQLLTIAAAPSGADAPATPSANDFSTVLEAAVGDDDALAGLDRKREPAAAPEPNDAEGKPVEDANGESPTADAEADAETDDDKRDGETVDRTTEISKEDVSGHDEVAVSLEADAAVDANEELPAPTIGVPFQTPVADQVEESKPAPEQVKDPVPDALRSGIHQVHVDPVRDPKSVATTAEQEAEAKQASQQTAPAAAPSSQGDSDENKVAAAGRALPKKAPPQKTSEANSTALDEFVPLVKARTTIASANGELVEQKVRSSSADRSVGQPAAASGNATAQLAAMLATESSPGGAEGQPDVAEALPATSDANRSVSSPEQAPTLSRLATPRGIHPAAPSTETDAGPTVDSPRFVHRVSGAIEAAGRRDGRIQVRLSPPELGSLRIELVVKQGILTAKLETETSAARHALLDNLPALRARLAEQDIRVEQFDVDVRRDGQGAPGGEPDDRQPDQPSNDRRENQRGRVDPESEEAAGEESQQGDRDAGPSEDEVKLDIRI